MAHPLKDIPSSFGPLNLEALLLPAKHYHYFQDGHRFPFDAKAKGHSPINAWWLADSALLAYETPENIQAILGSVERFDLTSFLPLANARTGLDGFGVQGNDFALLALRGTEFYRPDDILKDLGKWATSGIDLLQDAKLGLKRFDGPPRFDAPVVCGFYEPLQSLWPELKRWIDAIPPSKSLWLTGHSLGAAIAALIAFQFPERVAGLYTFGCPCPGGEAFAEAFGRLGLTGRSFRYVHGDDLVAKGLTFPGSRYRHVGTLRTLEAESRKNFLERAWNEVLPLDLTDHAPLYYALHVWNLMPD